MVRAVGGTHRPAPNRQPVVFAVAGFVLGLAVATCAMSWPSLGSGAVEAGSCSEEELRRAVAAAASNADIKLQRRNVGSRENGAAKVSPAPSTALARPASTAALTTSWTPRCLGVKVPPQGQVRVMSEA